MTEILSSPKRPKAKPDLTLLNPGIGHNGEMPDPNKVLVFVGKLMELEAEKKAVAKKIKDLNYQIANAGIPVRAMNEAGADRIAVAVHRQNQRLEPLN